MPIAFACSCGKQLQVGDELAGKAVRCPACMKTIPVPAPGAASKPAPSPAASSSSTSAASKADKSSPKTAKRMSGKAIFALILALTSFVGSLLFGIPAAIVGVMALMDVRRSKGTLGGSKLAMLAIALGLTGCLCNVPVGVFGVIFGVGKYKEASARDENEKNLKTIGEALKKYQADKQEQGFPPGVLYHSGNGQPLLSWRVELLLYLDDSKIYREFKLDESWDSENNKPLVEKMPKVFAGPSEEETKKGLTHYRIFHKPSDGGKSPNPVFVIGRKLQLKDIKEPSSTILVVEAADAVPWTRPEEIVFPVSGSIENKLFSPAKKNCTILYADGSVRTFKKGELTEADLESAITVKGK